MPGKEATEKPSDKVPKALLGAHRVAQAGIGIRRRQRRYASPGRSDSLRCIATKTEVPAGANVPIRELPHSPPLDSLKRATGRKQPCPGKTKVIAVSAAQDSEINRLSIVINFYKGNFLRSISKAIHFTICSHFSPYKSTRSRVLERAAIAAFVLIPYDWTMRHWHLDCAGAGEMRVRMVRCSLHRTSDS